MVNSEAHCGSLIIVLISLLLAVLFSAEKEDCCNFCAVVAMEGRMVELLEEVELEMALRVESAFFFFFDVVAAAAAAALIFFLLDRFCCFFDDDITAEENFLFVVVVTTTLVFEFPDDDGNIISISVPS